MFDRRVGRLGLGQVSNNEVHLEGLVKKRRNDEAIRKIGHLLRHPISEVWKKSRLYPTDYETETPVSFNRIQDLEQHPAVPRLAIEIIFTWHNAYLIRQSQILSPLSVN